MSLQLLTKRPNGVKTPKLRRQSCLRQINHLTLRSGGAEIDEKLDQWIHNSIIRAEIRELIVKEHFKSFDLGVEYKKEIKK